MPTAPFGLAYGLGAGMAIAPQQMFNRQQQANQLAMQGLQQQLLQHQVAQQQAEEQAFSQPVAPQMEQPTMAQSLRDVLGTRPQMGGGPATEGSGGLPGMPEGGVPLAPGTVKEGVVPSLREATAPREVKHVTPYQKMAYELGQRADKLASMGFGRSAFALQQQAADAAMKHQSVALQQAGRAVMSGNYDSAIPYLNSVGFNVSDIHEDPDNPSNLIMSHPDGNESIVPRQAAQMIAADPTKMAEAMPMIEYRKSLAETAKERAATAAANQRSLESHRKALEDIAQQKLTAQKTVFGPTGAKTPAKQLLWDAAEEDARKLHPGATDQEIYEFVKDDPRVSTAKTNVQNALNIQIRSLQAEQKQYLNAMGQAPAQDPNNPRSVRYYELQNLINEARANLLQPRQHIPSPKAATPEQPKQNYDGEISPTGAWKFSGPLGKWVPNK